MTDIGDAARADWQSEIVDKVLKDPRSEYRARVEDLELSQRTYTSIRARLVDIATLLSVHLVLDAAFMRCNNGRAEEAIPEAMVVRKCPLG